MTAGGSMYQFGSPQGKTVDLNQDHVSELWTAIQRYENGNETQKQLFKALSTVIPQEARAGASS